MCFVTLDELLCKHNGPMKYYLVSQIDINSIIVPGQTTPVTKPSWRAISVTPSQGTFLTIPPHLFSNARRCNYSCQLTLLVRKLTTNIHQLLIEKGARLNENCTIFIISRLNSATTENWYPLTKLRITSQSSFAYNQNIVQLDATRLRNFHVNSSRL